MTAVLAGAADLGAAAAVGAAGAERLGVLALELPLGLTRLTGWDAGSL